MHNVNKILKKEYTNKGIKSGYIYFSVEWYFLSMMYRNFKNQWNIDRRQMKNPWAEEFFPDSEAQPMQKSYH